MVISSRTPEGQPNRCPVCGRAVCIEPSLPLADGRACGDAPCPNCGSLLWFVSGDAESRLYQASELESLAKQIAGALAGSLGASADDVVRETAFLDDLGGDSLDTVELVMELEEQGIALAGDDAARIATVADAIAFLQSHRPPE